MREVELKLDLTGPAADALETAGILSGTPKVRRMQAVYHDTPERDLAQAGVSLRIRAAGDERIQTIKADGAGHIGLFARSEWEIPVDGDVPVLDYSSPVRALLGERVGTITPEFEVHVERRAWMVAEGDAKIEVVLDRGEVLREERRDAICELELELKEGAPPALFALARKIDDIVPVRLGVLTKAERGYRLSEPVRSAHKAEPIALDTDMTAARAFQHVAQACVRQFRLNEAVLLKDPAPEALHQARVALRRLRSAFSIFKPLLPTDLSADRLREELRWLAGELGHARDLDVLLARASGGALQERIRVAREDAYAHVDSALGSMRVRRLMLDLMQWLTDGPWLQAVDTQARRDEPVREFAAAALERIRRTVKKRGRDLGKLDDEARHELRKSAKKLRYASEFFSILFAARRRRYKRFVAALEALQDQLGSLNDLATAPDVIARLGIADDPDTEALLARGKRKTLIGAASEAYDDLVDTKRFWL